MNKTLLLLAIPSLVTACVEPQRYDAGEPMGAETDGDVVDEPEDDAGEPEDDDGEPDDDTGETDGDAGETGGDDDAGETGGPQEPACDLETHACIDPVPEGWSGPVRTKDPSAAADCGAGWATEALTSFDGVFANASTCSCQCGDPHGGECDDTTDADEYLELFGNVDACEDVTRSFTLGASWINPNGANAVGLGVRFIVQPPDVADAGECSPDPASYSEAHPTVQYEGRRTACAAEQLEDLGACDNDGLCVPQGDSRFEPGVCIWREGDVACPDGAFTERRVTYTDVLDTRACGQCSCGSAQGEACADAEVRVNTSPYSHQYYFDADGSCQSIEDEQGNFFELEYVHSLHLDPGEPSGGSCDGTRETYGDVEAIDPVTICCTPG